MSSHVAPRWTVWISSIVCLLIAAAFFNHVFNFGLLGTFGKYALIASLILGFIVLYLVLGAHARALSRVSTSHGGSAGADLEASSSEKEGVRLAWGWLAVVLGVPVIGWCLSDFRGGWSSLVWMELIAALSAAWFVLRQRRSRQLK